MGKHLLLGKKTEVRKPIMVKDQFTPQDHIGWLISRPMQLSSLNKVAGTAPRFIWCWLLVPTMVKWKLTWMDQMLSWTNWRPCDDLGGSYQVQLVLTAAASVRRGRRHLVCLLPPCTEQDWAHLQFLGGFFYFLSCFCFCWGEKLSSFETDWSHVQVLAEALFMISVVVALV